MIAHMQTRLVVVILAGLSALFFQDETLAAPLRSPALTPDTQCLSPHCYATREMVFGDDSPVVGVLAILDSSDPYVEAGFVAQAVWIVHSYSPDLEWVEFGVYKTDAAGDSPQSTLYTYCGGCGGAATGWGYHGLATGRDTFKMAYDSYNGVWAWWINGKLARRHSTGFAGGWSLPAGGESYVSSTNDMGPWNLDGLRYKRQPSCPFTCTGWWVPWNTDALELGGPPPTPRKYWTYYSLNVGSLLQVFTQ